MVITIERQYGSGGRLVGEKLAKLLGYEFYDRELLKIAARESGMSEDVVEHFDERPTNSLFLSSYLLSSYMMSDAIPLNQKLAFAQFDVIRKVAQSGDCVIVGRLRGLRPTGQVRPAQRFYPRIQRRARPAASQILWRAGGLCGKGDQAGGPQPFRILYVLYSEQMERPAPL